MKVLVYKLDSGEVTGVVEAPQEMISMQCAADESYIEGDGADDTHYVDIENRTIEAKLDYDISALPLPCMVQIEGVQYEVSEQPIFEFDVAGEYEIEVDAGPRFLRKTFNVNQA